MAEVLTADKENIVMTASHHREDAALCEKETAVSNSHHADELCKHCLVYSHTVMHIDHYSIVYLVQTCSKYYWIFISSHPLYSTWTLDTTEKETALCTVIIITTKTV